jgi:hypothetical protein
MTVAAASASITSTIKVNTRVEDLPAKLVGSGYVVILIGLVLLVWAGLTAYGAYSKNSFGDVHFSVWALLGALCLLAIAALSCNSIYSLQPNESAVLTLFGSYFGTDSTPGLRAAFRCSEPKRYHGASATMYAES